MEGGPDVSYGLNRKYSLRADDVRSTPESGLKSDIAPCPKGAMSGCEQPQQIPSYSITSSARARSVSGTSRPSALAVLRLITSSYFVGACTSRSAGFSPRRMRSTSEGVGLMLE